MLTLQKPVRISKKKILVPDKFKENSPNFMKFGCVTNELAKQNIQRGGVSVYIKLHEQNYSYCVQPVGIFCHVHDKKLAETNPSSVAFIHTYIKRNIST